MLKIGKNKWLFLVTFLLVLLPTFVFAINRIYLSNIDGTSPTTISVPSSGSLLSGSGIRYITHDGTAFFGWKTSTSRTQTSVDGGATWSQQSLFAVTGGGIGTGTANVLLLSLYDGSSGTIRRSVNGGVSSALVYTQACTSAGPDFYSLTKAGTTGRYWAAICHTALNSKTIYSDDETTWIVADTGINFCNGPAGAFVSDDGVNVAISSTFSTVPACAGKLRVSTDSGATWSDVILSLTGAGSPCSGAQNYSNVVKVNAMYYVVCSADSGKPVLVSTSTLSSWGATSWIDLPFTTGGTLSDVSLGKFNDNINDHLFMVTYDPSAGSVLKVWSLAGSMWTLVHNTGVVQQPGNIIRVGDALYFGTNLDNVYQIQ